jgi:aminopeptidase N
MNRYAKHQTWEWMTKEWAWLEKNLGNDPAFPRFPVYAARSFSDSDFLPEFEAFFDKVANPGLERTVKQGIDIIEWQSAWRERDLALLKAYFKAQ